MKKRNLWNIKETCYFNVYTYLVLTHDLTPSMQIFSFHFVIQYYFLTFRIAKALCNCSLRLKHNGCYAWNSTAVRSCDQIRRIFRSLGYFLKTYAYYFVYCGFLNIAINKDLLWVKINAVVLIFRLRVDMLISQWHIVYTVYILYKQTL